MRSFSATLSTITRKKKTGAARETELTRSLGRHFETKPFSEGPVGAQPSKASCRGSHSTLLWGKYAKLVVVEAVAFPWLLLAVSESLLCENKSPSSWLEATSSRCTTEDCEYRDAIKSPNAIQIPQTPSNQPNNRFP
jgi:hypothetical protein